MKKKLMIAGGGTGGHVLAGIAVAEEWKKQFGADVPIHFIGSQGGHEEHLVPKHGYPLTLLKIGALNRVDLKTRLITLFQLPMSFLRAIYQVIRFRPDAVLGVGGYASGPVVLIARFLTPLWGGKTAILEQNSVAGFTNRFLGKFVHTIFCAFEEGKKNFPAEKCILTGNPIRSLMKRMSESKDDPFTLFVFGGSQGAVGMNTMVLSALPYLKDQGIQIIHQTGKVDFDRVTAAYQAAQVDARIEKFIDDMGSCYEKASLIICRAGAGTLSELARVGRAAIFVPLPTAADNHQEVNARIYEKQNASLVVPQGSMDGKTFSDLILKLKNNPALRHQMEKKVASFDRENSARDLVKAWQSV